MFIRLRLRQNTSPWASGGPAGKRRLSGEDQHGRCTAEQSKYYQLYLNIGMASLAAK